MRHKRAPATLISRSPDDRKTQRSPRPPAHVRPLLDALIAPETCAALDESAWDLLIRLARSARLLGVLAHRVSAAVDGARLPASVQRHLVAAQMEARFRRQKTLHLLHAINPLLKACDGPRVLLKGAAYIVQDLPVAQGRLPADVDLMVPRTSLDGIERALLDAGWEFEKTDPYNQHYYRAWSHELPPLRAAGQALELDLHHTILPPLGRVRPDTGRLFADALPLPGSPFHALAPVDQVLHAMAHLVQDSDCVGRLRDLVDIDALLRAGPATDRQWADALVERARLHGMEHALWMACALCDGWFGTPGCAALEQRLHPRGPARVGNAWLLRGASRVLAPTDPRDELEPGARFAGWVLEARAVWVRMPPHLVVYHALAKGFRAVTRWGSKHAEQQRVQA